MALLIKNGPIRINFFGGGEHFFASDEIEAMLEQEPQRRFIIQEALEKLQIPEGETFLEVEIDLGVILGMSNIIRVEKILPNEYALFGRRPGAIGWSRIAPGAPLSKTEKKVTFVTLVLEKKEWGSWYLVEFWYGKKIPKEPWEPGLTKEEKKESLQFWSEHAFRDRTRIIGKAQVSTWEKEITKVQKKIKRAQRKWWAPWTWF